MNGVEQAYPSRWIFSLRWTNAAGTRMTTNTETTNG